VIKLGCDESLPQLWAWKKAQEIMDVRDGTHDSPKYVDEGIPLVTSKNLVGSEIDFSSCQYITKVDHEQISKRSEVHDGDLLYAMIGTIGNPVIVKKNQDFSIKNVALFKFNNADIYNRYFYYFLESGLAGQQLSNNSRGGTQKFVSLGNLRDLQVPLPPLPEQKRIAAILDKADAIRRKRQQAIQLADLFLRAVFLDMFGDPVTNPKGWEVKPLVKGVNKITSGWSAKGMDYPCSIGELGVLKISAVTTRTFIPEENKCVPLESIPVGKKLILPRKGDLLFSRANTRELVAATCIVEEDRNDVFLPDKLWLISLDEGKLLPEFVHFLIAMPKFRFLLTSQATGTSGSMLNISKSKFELTESIYPPIDVQKKFKKLYWKLQTTSVKSKTSEGLLDSMFSSLSQKAFAGNL